MVLTHAGVSVLPGGFVGVDVFFVVSGFLITGLLLKEARERGSVSLLEFYVRRARRILPAAALTLVVTDVAAFFLLNFVRAEDAVADSLHAAAFAANFRFADRGVDYFAQSEPPSPILHYWSLSVEEQFYFVWPLLLSLALFGVALGRRRRRRTVPRQRERWLLRVVVVLAAASLGWSIYLTTTLPTQAYFSPFTRAWELGLGATLAVCASTLARAPAAARVLMGWAGLAAIAAAAVAFSNTTPFPGWAALLPTVGTALAIVAGMGDRTPRLAVAPLLSTRPMTIVGDRSYALYLWHWPVLILAAQYAGDELSLEAKLALLAGAFLLSCVSYALVENPIRRRVRSRAATGVVVAVCMAAVLATAGTSLGAIDRKQHRFEAAATSPATDIWQTRLARGSPTAVVAAVRAARRGAPIPAGLTPPIGKLGLMPRRYAPANECIAHDSSSRVAGKVCRVGRPSSRKVMVLIGDSHAYMWLPPVVELARRDGWAVVPLLRLGCTPGKWVTNEGSKACQAWFRWAVRQVDRLDPQVTLLGGSIPEQDSRYRHSATTGILAAARALKPFSRVVVIGDPEGLGDDPVDCVLSSRASMARCTTTWPAASLAGYDGVARETRRLGVGFLATRGFVCFERQCPAVIGRTIAWMDNNHLTPQYAAELSGVFRAAFLRAVSKPQAPTR